MPMVAPTLELEDGRDETVDCLIWAIGREPANDNINQEAAGVKTNEKGYIVVDKYQNTNIEGIYRGERRSWCSGADTGGSCSGSPSLLNACLITSRI